MVEEDAPYWTRHYGIAHPWSTSPRIRGGRLLFLVAALLIVVVVLVAGVIVTLLG